MKVICIDKSKFINYYKIPMVQAFIDKIKEGETYTVIQELTAKETQCELHGGYILEEFGDVVWEKEGFAPISDQDNLQLTEQEAEMIRRRHLVHIKLVS